MPAPMAAASRARAPVSGWSPSSRSGACQRVRMMTAATGRMHSIIRRSVPSLSSTARCEPAALPAKLPAAASRPTFRSSAPLFRKRAVAKVVPQAALNLLVP